MSAVEYPDLRVKILPYLSSSGSTMRYLMFSFLLREMPMVLSLVLISPKFLELITVRVVEPPDQHLFFALIGVHMFMVFDVKRRGGS